MENNALIALEQKISLLVNELHKLRTQNIALQEREEQWHGERAALIEKNDVARLKIESMISRLKALEKTHE